MRIVPGAAPTAEAVRELVERATDELLGHADVVPLGAGPHAAASLPEALRRRDGYEPTTRHGAARYTTWRSWQTEQAVLEAVEKGRAARVAVAPEDAVEAAVKEAELGEDQAEAVRRICQGGERVAVMVGPAGSGKSRSLSAARAAWQAAGVRVRGVAPSAVAAGVLTEQAGIPSETLAKFLLDAQPRPYLSRPAAKSSSVMRPRWWRRVTWPHWPSSSQKRTGNWSWLATISNWARSKPAGSSGSWWPTPRRPS